MTDDELAAVLTVAALMGQVDRLEAEVARLRAAIERHIVADAVDAHYHLGGTQRFAWDDVPAESRERLIAAVRARFWEGSDDGR